MKFSYNWIRELVDGLEVSPEELGRLLTMKTAECEGVAPVAPHLAQVRAARLLSVEPIPGSHNWRVEIDAGPPGRKVVVCAAPNCCPGMVSAYVPPGVRLGDRDIGCITIDGVASEGMLASGAELGVNRDAGGILELDAEPGAPIPGCAPDWVIETDNKSITNRPDLWGHHGLAREVAAILRLPLRDPVRLDLLPSGPPPVRVHIEDYALAPRYSALVFDNVTVAPSPLWLQYRLESIGLNPINNIVDVTNFVMAELAQPMHAFDQDTLKGDTILVRRARAGEKVLALNREQYELDESNLVIADVGGAIALAGVIGGLDTGIVEGTRRLVLESANFQASCIRKTSMRLKLRTDASMRFEKSQDPHNTVRGLARALELLRLVSPGIRLVGGLADACGPLIAPEPIRLPLDWLCRKLGRPVPPAEVRDILERLCFGVREDAPGIFAVSVPSWRATRDVSIKDDLVEEVGRVVGYDTIPPAAPLVPCAPPPPNPERRFHHWLRDLVAAQGFTEVYNYSFINEETARRFSMDPAGHVPVVNPISSEQGLLRHSLVPGIWKNVVENSKHFSEFRLFEIGNEIHPRAEGLPEEVAHLAACLYRREDEAAAGFFELKHLAESVLPGATLEPASPLPYEHPARASLVRWRGQLLGRMFELHPSLAEGRTWILDIDLRLMEQIGPAAKRYRPIRRFPASAFDLSVITGMKELVGNVEARLREFAGEALDSIDFLRQYTGPPLPEGSKSVSFRLTVASPERTLTSEEVSVIRAGIIGGMRGLGYELRV